MDDVCGNPRVTCRVATGAEIEDVIGHKTPYTVKALIFFYDGKPAGIGGYKIENGNFVVFSDIKEGSGMPKRERFKCFLKGMEMIKAKGLPMYVEVRNPRLCERLGFKKIFGSIYLWQQ